MRVIPSAYNGNGERKTLELIKQLDAKSHEVAFWSIHVNDLKYKEFSDIDFLLLTEKGICCIEVKGGRVNFKDGKFTYTDRYDNQNTKNESPGKQAATNKRSLKRSIDLQFPELANKICFAHILIFPDIDWDFSTPHYEMLKEIIFDACRFKQGPVEFQKFLTKAFSYFKNENIFKDSIILDAASIKKIRNFLRPDFDYLPSLRYQLDDVDRHIYKMTKEQQRVLSSIDGNDRIIIDGSAGSGKTILALKTAEKLISDGVACCYLIRNGHWNNAIKNTFTFIGCDVLCIESNFHTQKKYEAIIVDEGQDLLNDACFSNFLDLLKFPLDQSKVYWFMDSYNQSHLYEDIDAETIDLLSGDFFTYKLDVNCRNPVEVIKETNKLCGTNIELSNNASTREMRYEILNTDDPKSHGKRVQVIIDDLIDEGALLEDICILTLTNNKESCVNHLEPNTISMLHSFCSPVYGVNKIKFFDVLSFKGQESKFIIIVDCYSKQSLDYLQNYIYTSTTRSTFQPSMVINTDLYKSLLCL